MSSNDKLERCFIGKNLEEKCHPLSYTKVAGLKPLELLNDEEKDLVSVRSGAVPGKGMTICFHHEQTLLKQFTSLQRSCCDPFIRHKKAVKGCLREITQALAKELQQVNVEVVPGWKLCPTCRREVSKKLANVNEGETLQPELYDGIVQETKETELLEELYRDEVREKLNSSLEEMDVSPIKLHGVASHSRPAYGKRKLTQIESRLQEQKKVIQKQISEAMNVTTESIQISEPSIPDNYDEVKKKADDLDILVALMKEKLKVSNRGQRLQILTLAPRSWSILKTMEEFEVTAYMVRQARKLAAEKGILGTPNEKKGKVISEDLKQRVVAFYCDDEYSRQMPGKKDTVSIRRNVPIQKRLLLCNLKELYSLFKVQNPEVKIGFSKFCSLRPKWCVLVGRSGTHSVCVCTIHQNVELMLASVKLSKDRHLLMDMLVCNRDSKQCMVHRCKSCPPMRNLEEYLLQQFETQNDNEEEDEDNIEEQIIQFQQWTTVDRAELVSQSLPVSDFVNLLAEKLNNLTSHSYIAKSQMQYLKKCKENLKENELIVLGDFAENYKFVVQDEVQGYHWNQQGCTLHPVITYFKKDSELKHVELCFISDDLNHDTSFVYEVICQTIKFAKYSISNNVKRCLYFSDGCAGQYKNCKNFMNLCLHKKDFQIDCSWSFFATSHGKSPCDGLGGTLKRLAARASLQRPTTEQILSAEQLLEFCQKEVPGIKVFFISKLSMESVRKNLKGRFDLTNTLPGTQSYHEFNPISETVMAAKRVSVDKEYAIQYDLVKGKECLPEEDSIKIKISDFIVCYYDEEIWIGLVDDLDDENEDAQVKFMHPNYPSRSYSWPRREDICFVPFVNIICIISTPSTATGRQYVLNNEDKIKIESELNAHSLYLKP